MSHSISHSCLTPHTPRLTLGLIYKEWDMNPNPSHIPWLTSHPMRSETPHVSLLVWYVNLWCVRSDTCGVRHEKLDMGCEEWEMRSDAWGEECDMGCLRMFHSSHITPCITPHVECDMGSDVRSEIWCEEWDMVWGVRHHVICEKWDMVWCGRRDMGSEEWDMRKGGVRHGVWGVTHEERRSETWCDMSSSLEHVSVDQESDL